MRKRSNWYKRLLAGLLSAAMVTLNISTVAPAFAVSSMEDLREDAELINDLALPKDIQRQLRQSGSASPSDAAAKEKKAEDLTAGSARWGTPSNAAKVLHTQLDGVEIEVSAPAGVLPEGASLKARKLSEEEEKEVLEKINEHAEAAGKSATTQFLCDLTVLNATGEAVQPDNTKGTLAVSFRNVSIVSAEGGEIGNISEHMESQDVSILHLDESSDKADTLREGLDENLPVLQAKAEHFSPFAIVNYQPNPTPTIGVGFQLLEYDNASRADYKLKNVNVINTTGNNITSISVQVNSGYIYDIPAYVSGTDPNNYLAFTDINVNHLFYQVVFPTPLTPAEVKTFIETKFHFHLDHPGANQQLTVTVGNGRNTFPTNATIKLSKAIIPNPMPGDSAEHYYMYVEPQPAGLVSWADSYNTAKQTYLDGMQGYLVTVTSPQEDTALDQITNIWNGAWAGGARFEGINDADSVPAWHNNYAAGRTAGSVFENQNYDGNSTLSPAAARKWRWQDGPEAGIEYFQQGTGGGGPNGNGIPLSTPYGTYSHFNPSGEPTSAGGYHGGAATNGFESVMQVHNGGYWNDLHNVSEYAGNGWDVKGFYIEFSRYKASTSDTNNQVVSLNTAAKVSAIVGGQTYYSNNVDNAIAWSQQNGNAPLTLIGDTTLTKDVPAGVTIDLNGHTLTVPAGSNVTNNGTINATNPASNLAVQGSNGTITNGTGGQITRNITIKMNDRTVTATEPLTWAVSDATITGGFIGTDRVSALMVNFDNSSTAQAHPTLPVTAENPDL